MCNVLYARYSEMKDWKNIKLQSFALSTEKLFAKKLKLLNFAV